MQPEERDVAYLWDMLDAARQVIEFTRNVAFPAYLEDRKLQYAVERAVEIIGEAANRISPALQQKHSEIPWRKIVAQRNVLAHEYGDVDPSLMWDLAQEHIPALVRQLETLIPPKPPETEAS
ncbi:MAG TPA: DUF86 domain-containing protein [Thermoanaerobaculia bacterium]|nr:DUF86 domain-containing protein [Thermoanaerobaculia bacterium]